ncbi:MAG: hypothetical protein HGA47_01475 [Zoogloea sp.]|nr:hypothetical protein [Zoogloea sp.]
MTPGLPSHRHVERGWALVAALLLAIVAALGLLARPMELSPARLRTARALHTGQVLARAKEALLARAGSDADTGTLPCPDRDGNGIAALLSGNHCPQDLGWLPWRTLDLPELRDAAQETLWYAVSRSVQDKGMNGGADFACDAAGEFSLDGRPGIAAIVFAPGEPLPGQTGRPGSRSQDYLDAANTRTTGQFSGIAVPEVLNDRAITVSCAELARLAQAAAARAAQQANPPAAGKQAAP